MQTENKMKRQLIFSTLNITYLLKFTLMKLLISIGTILNRIEFFFESSLRRNLTIDKIQLYNHLQLILISKTHSIQEKKSVLAHQRCVLQKYSCQKRSHKKILANTLLDYQKNNP